MISDFDILKDLLYSEEWPEAVLEFQIANKDSEPDKCDRAEGILDALVEENLNNKNFLDFGCGEGHVCKYAANFTSVSIGYDILCSGDLEWENENKNYFLTKNLNKVVEKSPFDIILIHDVLDHSTDPLDILIQSKNLLKENGTIYLRTHPWCARHGTHFYRNINKAFINLVFSEQELNTLGLKNNQIIKNIYPIKYYNNIIKNSNLKIKKFETENQEVEDFFKNNELVKNRILKNWNLSKWNQKCPEFQMQQCFLDFILTK